MTHATATTQFESAASLHSMGAIVATQDPAIPGKFLNYVATHEQDIAQGSVKLELSEESKRSLAAAQTMAKPDRKLEAMQAMSPTAKTSQAQKAGIELRNAMMLRQTGRRPDHFAALKAMGTAKPPIAAPKPQPIAVKPVVPTETIMPIGQMKNTNKPNHTSLRLIAANPAAPKKSPAPQPTLAQRQKYWSRSTGYACQLG